MNSKPMTEYLEEKYRDEKTLDTVLDSVNQILGRLSCVEKDVAEIRRHCNNI